MQERFSSSHAVQQVAEEDRIALELRGRVVGATTAIIAGLSFVVAVLLLANAFDWLQFPAFDSVSNAVQLYTSLALGFFSLTTASARFFQGSAASVRLAKILSILLAAVIIYYLPEVAFGVIFPQVIWLPVLFGAATVSGPWAAVIGVGTFVALAVRYPSATPFHSPGSLAVSVGLLALVLALRWLFDEGLRATARSHQRILTTLRSDALTGLPNRTRLMEMLQEQGAADGFNGIAVARFDVDGFGAICDALGDRAADDLLIAIAADIRTHLGANPPAARIGADDFALLIRTSSRPEEAVLRVEALLQRLEAPREVAERSIRLTLKAGIAFGGDLHDGAEPLLQRADLALSEAKQTGQRVVVRLRPASVAAGSRRAFEIAQSLFGASARGELAVVYQPIVALRSGRLIKAEALLRWNHPTLGAVSPVEFIPVAEQIGAIHEMGDWVADEATRFAARVRATYEPNFQMSINRSPVQFRADGDELPALVGKIREMGLGRDAVFVEITEGVLLDGREANRSRLHRLREACISLSLDDFGTGYASLAQLHDFEIDIVKIDRRFVSGLAEGNREQALCAGIISLAHSLGMKVVAEGVETAEQRDLLLGLGCDYGQGWHFGRPVTPEAFEALLQQGAGVA